MVLSTEPSLSLRTQQPACVPVERKDKTLPPPRPCVASSLERLFQRMRDASNMPRDEGPSVNNDRPAQSSRSLRRTTSSASLDTIRAPSTRSVRRKIDQMGPKTVISKQQHATKKNKRSTSNNGRENSPELTSDTECSPGRKRGKNGRKALGVLQDTSDQPEEEDISNITARLLETAPTAAWALQPSLFSGQEEEQPAQGCSFPTRNLKPAAHIENEPETTSRVPQIVTVDINHLSLTIRPYDPDLTIWDGHKNTHHIFKCHLLLRCTAQPFDILALPDVRRIEIVCTTLPIGRGYTDAHAVRPPRLLRTTYKGARIDVSSSSPSKPVELDPTNGIHVDKTWRAMLDPDGTWGWYAATYVPVPARLFDKIEYRRFELNGRVWVGENVLEGALTFGMSMLFREVDMK